VRDESENGMAVVAAVKAGGATEGRRHRGREPKAWARIADCYHPARGEQELVPMSPRMPMLDVTPAPEAEPVGLVRCEDVR
jgi:hypothetical protein